MKVVMVLTSNGELGGTGEKTGLWLEEFAAPYYILADAGVGITLASPKGGKVPIDPKSEEKKASTLSTVRFKKDKKLRERLEHTELLSKINADFYDAVFYPGGHGLLWDLAHDLVSVALIETFVKLNKPMAFICHAPAVLSKVKLPSGDPMVQGKEVTGFSNSEEEALRLTNIVPFLLEEEFKRLGANYSKSNDGTSYVKRDGLLITGQNSASSEELTMSLLTAMREKLDADFPGYNIYPESEDIYHNAVKEGSVNPEDISEKKSHETREGKWNEKSFKEDKSGDDLDVPGAELDDNLEINGDEDEENNYYSIGGDNHENLDENKGDS
jgi:putative intracellular protease/amidase